MQRFYRLKFLLLPGFLPITFFIILTILILGFLIPIHSKNKNFLNQKTLEKMGLKTLLIHEAEWLSQKGYIPPNSFFRSQIQNNSAIKEPQLWKSKTFFLQKFSQKEKQYLFSLQKRISLLKEKTRIKLLTQLKAKIEGEFLIQFSRLADLDGDGTWELLAIAGKNFEKYPASMLDSPYKDYYQQAQEFHVFVLTEGSSYTHRKISQENWGIAEYISDFASDYYLKNGKEQVKIVLHSFSLETSVNKLHWQKVYLFSLENKKLQIIFTHPIYENSYRDRQEKTLEYQMEFQDVQGVSTPEILLRRKRIHRVYTPAKSPKKNHEEKIERLGTLYFQYNALEKIFQRMDYSKTSSKKGETP